MPGELQDAAAVLSQYGLAGARLAPLGSGLINLTWLVTDRSGQRFVLQRVAGLFPPGINRDIDVVTRELESRGLLTPRLIPAGNGHLWVESAGHVWRLCTWLAGDCYESLATGPQAGSAGRLLARFHVALAGLEHEFANPRLGVHDTARHLAALRDALARHADHPRFAQVAPLAGEILAAASALPAFPVTADRVVHGDPKISNVLFDPDSDEAVALVDLDTVGWMPLPLELGDALRSWCNPTGENGRRGEFSAPLFAAALAGYAEIAGDWLTPEEAAAILPATETIIVELAARFCADALNESYFAWDPLRFETRSEHNEARAAGQLSLAASLAGQRAALAATVQQVFRP